MHNETEIYIYMYKDEATTLSETPSIGQDRILYEFYGIHGGAVFHGDVYKNT